MVRSPSPPVILFFFNDTATTEIYTLSLHDALPICSTTDWIVAFWVNPAEKSRCRSEEHTSELQSRVDLVCRLLLEKKKTAIGCLPRSENMTDSVPGVSSTGGRPVAWTA